MTELDALDRAFLKGSGVSSFPNKGKSAAVDPIDAAFMRGLGQTPTAEVANTPARVPFTPTPVSPQAMAGAIIRGIGEGTVQGLRDIGVTAGKSIIGVGETAVGLVDLASAPVQALFSKLFTGRVQLGQVGKMLEDVGVDFETTQDILSTLYSDEQKQALQNVSEKESAKEKLVALGANPTVPIHSVLQSIPSMMLAASGSEKLVQLGMSEWLAGALGEGWVQAGSAQEQFRQQSDTGYTTPKQTSLAVASGLVTAAISAASGKASKGMGLEDVESIGASGSSRGSNLEFWRKLVGGMFMEGPVEEGLQSSTEKIAENLALGRPWNEGVEGAYTEGSVSGAAVGAVANALPSKGKSKTSPTLDADAWIKANADMLPTIAAKEKLSRNDWQKLGLPRVPEAERAAFLQKVKDTAKEELAKEQAELDVPTEAEAEANKPAETPVVAEAKAVAERKKGKRVPKAPVPEANAAVDEVQAELDAQAAEDAADEAAYALFGKREAKPTDTAAEVVKPVEAPVVAEAKAVEERKKGKRVPKAPKPVNKGKGVVEPVVEAPVVKESLSTPVEQSPTTVADVAAPAAPAAVERLTVPKWADPQLAQAIQGLVDRDDVAGRISIPKLTTEQQQDLVRRGFTFDVNRMGEPLLGVSQNAYDVDVWSEEELSRLDKLRQERDKLRQEPKDEAPVVKKGLKKAITEIAVDTGQSIASEDLDEGGRRQVIAHEKLQTREVKTGRKGVTKKAGGESVLPSAANAEQAETIEGRFIKQLPSGRWVVQSEENRQRAERGEREIGGDRLFASREEAVKETKLEIEIDRRNAALKATEAAAQAEREAAAAKREAPLNAYLDTITTTPLQRGKLKTTLSKQVARRVSSTGKVYSGSRFEVVNQMVGDGFKADAVEVDAIKDVSRVQWNRMDGRQQREWDARRKAAGKKTEYRLVNTEQGNFYDISKTEYDYAKSLEADAAQPSASKATPEKPAGVATSGQRLPPDYDPASDEERFYGSKVTIKEQRARNGKVLRKETIGRVDRVLKGSSGGNVFEVVPDGYEDAFRYDEGDIVIDELVDNKADKKDEVAPIKSGRPSPGKFVPASKEYNSTAQGQKDMSARGSRISMLKGLNRAVGKVYTDGEIESAADENIDAIRDYLIERQRQEALKDASAKEGALPKVATPKNLTESEKKQSKLNSALASSVAKAKAEGHDIELVDTVSDLPSDIRSQLPSDTSNIEGFYVNGKTYIIGENVTPDRAEAAVREEMAHRKLDTAKGKELIDGFKKRMTEKDRKALIKEGYTKTQGESDADYEARLANEFIAKQARKNTSAWTEFVDSVKLFLESVGVRDLTSEEAARVILRKLRGGAAAGNGVRYSLSENVWNTPQQKISSANTSINSSQLPASFRKISWVSGTRNADIGGGRFDNATEYLDGLGVENVIYDPYNRSQEHNDAAVAKISNGNSDTATVNNVLNVIAEESARESVIKQAANAISEDGVAYFLIYQGNGSGVGTPTKAGWQENRKADSYTDEIAKHFGKVTRQGNMLVASQPKKGGSDIRYSLREQDASYLAAVERGGMDTAQKMVDEALKKATPKGHIRLFRGLERDFDPSYPRDRRDSPTGYSTWTDSRQLAREYAGEGGHVYTITIPKTEIGKEYINQDGERALAYTTEKPAGLRGVKGKEFLVYEDHENYDPAKIKSADPVTYDDAGNVIPLSERFNADSNDIRYSLTPAAELDEAKYESAKGIFGPKLERVGEAEFRKWVSEKLPDSAMPYAERFLSERSAMATVPKKKFVTGISRKVVDAELESMGQTPSEGGGQPSWPQLMAQAKADIKANSSAGDSLIANLIENPHPLTQEEIALLNLTKVQRWNEQVAAYESKDKKRLDAAVKRMDEVYFVSALGPDKSKSMQGAALNALKMMTNEKYELVNLVQEYYQATGDVASPGSQAYKDLEAIAQQYKERTEVLERENARLQEEATTMNQSLADALAQAAYNQGKPKSKGKPKAAKIASVADVISKKSRDYGISLIEQARKEQAALNMRASAGVDPARLLMLSKFAAGHIMLGVSDVAAKVSEFYGSKVTAAEMAQIMSEANKIVLDARNRFAKEAESETLASRVIPKGKGSKAATQLSEVSLKDMFREQAENGVKTFKEALPLVGKLVRDSGINATDLQIQDAYSSYINEPGVLSTDTIKKVIAAYRQEAQLLSKINDAKKGVRPHKIGVPRFPSSQEARALEKELDNLMKNVTFSGDKKPTDIASPLDAKKTWMQNEIDDLEKAIALHEERFQGEKGITDQGDIEYQRLKAQLEDVRKRYAEAFPKKPLTQEEQLAILIKQEEKNVERWNKRVADAKSGKFKRNKRVQRPYSERLAELQYQRDNAKAEVARLYELQNPGKRAREAQMKRDLAAIKEMKRRMAAGDYTTRQTKESDISGDPDAMAAHVAREQTKKTYEQYKARAAWNKLSKARRFAELAKNLLMSDKAIVYSGDNSFVGRQGWFFAMTHMVEWAKSTGKGLTALDTAKSATMIQEIKESDLFKSGVYKAAGININVKDATGNFSTTDDANLEVADNIPVLGEVAKVSGRLFGTDANLMRTNFLRVILEGSETGRKILANPYELTEKQKDFLKHVGWGVNVFTGFSNNKTIKAGVLLGAPNWALSVLENLTQAPVLGALLDGDFDAAWQLEKQYGRFYLATAALIAALSMLPSGSKDDEGKRKRSKVILDPRSNRFGVGYIPYTSIAFNVFGPLAPWVRFLGRNISGQKVSNGRVTNLRNTWLFFATDEERAQAVPYREGQMMDNLNFLRSKFRPLVSAAIGFQTGTDFYGNEVPRSRVLVESVSPLVPLHLIDNLVRVSPEQAAFESFMEAFGVDSKPDFNTPQYKKYEAKMKVVDEMFKLKFKDENGKSFGDRAEDFYIANAMKTLHGATDTNSSPGLQESAKMIIDDLGLDACLMLLEYQALDERRRRSGGKIRMEPLSKTTSSGELSAYGKRVQKLRIISAQ